MLRRIQYQKAALCLPVVGALLLCSVLAQIDSAGPACLAQQTPSKGPTAKRSASTDPANQADNAPPPLTSQPLSPSESLATFELPRGFHIELLAAEPLVQDPVAIQWGADGKLWVAEMADYPYGLDGKMSPGGRVRFLEDNDKDGNLDRSTVFLDQINFPTGVLPWRNGVLVTAAPEIFYAEDTDGDGRADVHKTLFTGFKEGNPQLRVNGLQWGLDGWVYCANGWSGGEVRCLLTGETVDLKRYDFRIEPDVGTLALESGISEFGRNRDDWGNWYGCDNTNVAWHFALEERYLRRNPHLVAPDPRKQFLPTAPRVFARSQLQKRYHTFEHADRYTSACSVLPYRDELLFEDDAQHMFVCEPVHNLVQHLVLAREKSSFAATVPEHAAQKDFLTSTDPWFRPVSLRTGPDGALWVVDMYRYMIEHPEWLPDEGKRELAPHYRAGEDRGRIYRIYHEDRPPRRWLPLAGASADDLMEALETPNGAMRDMAQQQLIWRGDKRNGNEERDQLVQRLSERARASRSGKARLQALFTLAGLDAVEPSHLLAALRDDHAMVRRAAVRLAEQQLDDEAVRNEVVRLAGDEDPAVLLQVACTLGQTKHEDGKAALAKIVAATEDDPYLAAAVLSSLDRDNLDASFHAAMSRARANADAGHRAVELVRLAGLFERDDLVLDLLADLAPHAANYAAWKMEAAERWLHTIATRKKTVGEMFNHRGTQAQQAARQWDQILRFARERAADSAAEATLRSACLRLALRNPPDREGALELASLALGPQTPHEVQHVAVQELASFNTAEAGERLLDRWKTFGPSVRQEVLSAVLTRPKLSEELIARLENRHILPAEIDAASRQRLLSSKSDELRRRAKLLFGDVSTERKSIVDEFEKVGELAGDAARGREVFAQKCSACHAQEGSGHAVGPDLASLSDRSTKGLLAAILDPSRAIEPKYASYTAIMTDGRTYSGILAAETAAQVTLVEQENRRHLLARSEIEDLSSSEKSLMPDGFEKDLSRQQLADVIRYLQSPQEGAPAR